MKTPSEMILAEIPEVATVVNIARLVESRIRGEPVSPHDPSVQLRAAEILLAGVGADLRTAASNEGNALEPLRVSKAGAI